MFAPITERVARGNDRSSSHYNRKVHLNSFQTFMKPLTFSTFATSAFAALAVTSLAIPAWATASPNQDLQIAQNQVAQNSRAEQTCTDAANDRGLQVMDIISINPHSGGTEVIMEIRRSRNDTYQVGCDYSSGTRQVELYEIEDNNSFNGDRDNNSDGNSWQNQYGSDGVRNRSDAESIARQVVGDQLGIDQPYSSVVRIDNIARENGDRSWTVEGRANGAPFVVQIRADDGYVQDFQLR
jgi:hypothetical protein